MSRGLTRIFADKDMKFDFDQRHPCSSAANFFLTLGVCVAFPNFLENFLASLKTSEAFSRTMRSIQNGGNLEGLFEGVIDAQDSNRRGIDSRDIFNGKMRRKEKTTIVTFESSERMTIRCGARPVLAWCERCGEEVLMVTPNEAAAAVGSDARAIFRRVESGEIHFIESEGGALLICSKSLPLSL
jgi:hypothetical protein